MVILLTRTHRYNDRQGYYHSLSLDTVVNPCESPKPIGPGPGLEHARLLEQLFGQDMLSLWTLLGRCLWRERTWAPLRYILRYLHYRRVHRYVTRRIHRPQ
jgi:hypothetical protein